MATTWFSYDDFAEEYASAAEPAYFAKPAAELIAFLAPEAGKKLLDIGSGAGAVPAAALRVNRPPAVVASDVAVPMLVVGRTRVPGLRSVAAEVDHLPFASATFDAATLAFVLSHLRNPVATLKEVKRVLTAGGKVAVSSWSSSAAGSPPGDLWRRTSEQYIDSGELERAVATVVPSESRLATADGLVDTLLSADLTAVSVHRREYDIAMSTDDFVRSRLVAAPSRYMQARLDIAAWSDFVDSATRQLSEEFGSRVRFRISVNFATGAA